MAMLTHFKLSLPHNDSCQHQIAPYEGGNDGRQKKGEDMRKDSPTGRKRVKSSACALLSWEQTHQTLVSICDRMSFVNTLRDRSEFFLVERQAYEQEREQKN